MEAGGRNIELELKFNLHHTQWPVLAGLTETTRMSKSMSQSLDLGLREWLSQGLFQSMDHKLRLPHEYMMEV